MFAALVLLTGDTFLLPGPPNEVSTNTTSLRKGLFEMQKMQ